VTQTTIRNNSRRNNGFSDIKEAVKVILILCRTLQYKCFLFNMNFIKHSVKFFKAVQRNGNIEIILWSRVLIEKLIVAQFHPSFILTTYFLAITHRPDDGGSKVL
jgi:hypothetical protein